MSKCSDVTLSRNTQLDIQLAPALILFLKTAEERQK